MSRTLTGLIHPITSAAQVVSRELIGAIPAVTLNASSERAAVGQQITAPFTRSKTPVPIVPGPYPPDAGHDPIDPRSVAISRSESVNIGITGDDQLGLGDQWMDAFQREVEQGMRSLANAVELDLCGLYKYASRAHGTAGTAPFEKTGPGLSDASHAESILDDNGAPQMGRSLLLNSVAKTQLSYLTTLTNVSYAGDEGAFLRQGILGDLANFALRKSSQVQQHVGGSGTGYLIDNAGGYAKGDTVLHIDTGTGTVEVGDVIMIADDASGAQYVVTVGTPGPGDQDITIAEPGLQSGVADNKAVSIAGDYTANFGFSMDAVHLAARAPAVPAEGDDAVDSYIVTDPVSGLSFDVRMYAQHHQILYEVGLAWGIAMMEPRHSALLLG